MVETALLTLQAIGYGALTGSAFFIGLFSFWKRMRDEYYDLHQVFDHTFVSLFWAIVSARLGYIVMQWQFFGFDVVKWVSLSSVPGFIGAVGLTVGLIVFARRVARAKWNLFDVLDMMTMPLMIGIILFVLANALAGVRPGMPTTLPWGVVYPGTLEARHPVQLYLFGLLLLGSFLLAKVEREYRTYFWYRVNRRTAQPGFVITCLLIVLGCAHLAVAPFSQSHLLVSGVAIEYILAPLVLSLGASLIWVRSGRGLPFAGK